LPPGADGAHQKGRVEGRKPAGFADVISLARVTKVASLVAINRVPATDDLLDEGWDRWPTVRSLGLPTGQGTKTTAAKPRLC
jgi:hypothetical protein